MIQTVFKMGNTPEGCLVLFSPRNPNLGIFLKTRCALHSCGDYSTNAVMDDGPGPRKIVGRTSRYTQLVQLRPEDLVW